MQEEASDKLISRNGYLFTLIFITAIFVFEGHSVVINRNNPVIGDCYPMGLSPKVFKHLFRTTERLL